MTVLEQEPSSDPAPATVPPDRAAGKGGWVRKALWAVFGRGGMAIFMLLSAMLLGRILSPNEFGHYTVYLSLIAVASQLAPLGLNIVVLRWLSQSQAHGQTQRSLQVIRSGVRAALLPSACISLLCGVAAWFLSRAAQTPPPGLLALAVAIVLCTWLQTAVLFLGDIFRALQMIKEAAIWGGTGMYLLFTAAVAAAAPFGKISLLQVLWLQIALLLLSAAAGLWRLRAVWYGFAAQSRIQPALHATLQPIVIGGMLREAIPQVLTLALGTSLSYIDLWVMGVFGTPDELATYGFINRLMLGVTLPLSMVNVIIPPLIAELHTLDRRDQMERVLRGSATLAGIPTGGLLLLLIVAGGPVLAAVNPRFAAGATALAIVSLGRFLFTIGGSAGFVLMMTGRQWLSTIITLCSVSAYAVVACVAGAEHGMLGVAITSAAFTAGQKLALVIAARKTVGVRCEMFWSPRQAWPQLQALYRA